VKITSPSNCWEVGLDRLVILFVSYIRPQESTSDPARVVGPPNIMPDDLSNIKDQV
jgi:hypothetical protein